MSKKLAPIAATVAVALLFPLAGQAATGTDNANDPAYASGYNAGQNGGTGFGAYTVTSNAGAGTFVFTAAEGEGNSGTPPPSSIDSNGKSFGLFAGGSSTAQVKVTRPFTTSLGNTGDTFSLDFVTGYNDAGSSGVALTSGAATVGDFRFVAGGTGFTFNGTPTGLGFTPGALHLTYTVTAPGQYSFSSTGAVTFNGTGSFSSPLDGANITLVNTGAGTPDHNAYFNNLAVTNITPTPEPGGLVPMLLGTALLGGVIVARRRGVTA